jgi:hypothetical protein
MLNFLRRNRASEADGRPPIADPEPTPEERLDELMSAYLDDDLTLSERAELEARLAADDGARASFEGMRAVRDTLATLEVVRAPRSFAITAPPVRQQQRGLSRFDLVTRVGAMAASVAFVAVVAGDLSSGGTPVTEPTTFSSSERASSGDSTLSAPAASGATDLAQEDDDAVPTAGSVAADTAPADGTSTDAGTSPAVPAESVTPDPEATVEAGSAEMRSTEEPADSAGSADSEGNAGSDQAPTSDLPERSGGATDPPSNAAPAPDVEDPSARYGAVAPGAADATEADTARDGSAAGDGTIDPDAALGLQSDDTSATSANADESGVLMEDGREVSNLAIGLGSVATLLVAASGLLWWRRRGGAAGPI